MLSTISATTSSSTASTTTVRIKSLDSRLVHDEEKDLEQESQDLESEEVANNEPEEEEQSASELEAEQSSYSGLSSRASDIKEYLRERTAVKAVLLKQDGSTEEISYDASSSSTRSLLGGRPSIIGSIEELNLIVVQSLEQSPSASLNKHILPVPLCHNKSDGDYLVFRVDSQGKAADVSLKEYEQYVEDHKTLTTSAIKQFSADSVRIKSNSPFTSTSGHSMETVRGALETKFYVESESVDDSKKNESEIRDVVQQELQKLVDEVVNDFTASPMEDPDYKPEEDMVSELGDAESVSAEESSEQQLDERPWRLQLKDAMEQIRAMGRVHGQHFAENIASTFYELNGTDPALDELTSLYSKIRTDFANEAEEELDDESGSDAVTESETELEQDEDTESGDEWEEALNVVRDLGRQDGLALAEGVIDALYEYNGQQPSLDELTSAWFGIQDDLAAEADEESELEVDSEGEMSVDIESESEDDDESDIEDEYDEALDHIRDIGALDGEAMAGNLLQIMAEENGAEPSLREFTELWQSIQLQFVAEAQEEIDNEIEDLIESEDEDDDESGSEADSEYDALSVYQLAAATVGADWISRDRTLDDDASSSEVDESSEEDLDVDSQYRSETESKGEESDDSESEYDPDNAADQVLSRWDLDQDLEHEDLHFAGDSMLNTPMVQSKGGNGLSWNVYFDEDDLSRQAESSNLKRAMQGFKVRNHREANIAECKRMAAFLQVPSELVDEQDIQKPVAIATTRTRSKVFVSAVTRKQTSRAFSVYLNSDRRGNVDSAIHSFQRSNGRKPDSVEVSKIKAFLKMESDLSEQAFVLSAQQPLVFSDEIGAGTSGVVTKKTATGYTLNFEDDEKRDRGDEDEALKWFKRFNKREPSAEESQQIKQFIKADEEEMVDIE